MTVSSPPAPLPERSIGRRYPPLYAQVIIAVIVAVPVGLLLGRDASGFDRLPVVLRSIVAALVTGFELAPRLIIRALGALAAPLVVLAILSAIVTNEVKGRQGFRMMAYYLLNTLVAMGIGLAVSNAIRPGQGASLGAMVSEADTGDSIVDRLIPRPASRDLGPRKSVADIVTEIVPTSIGDAFASNNLAQLVLITVAFGIALVKLRGEYRASGNQSDQSLVDVLTVGFDALMKILLWVVALVPIAVFGIVAISIAREGGGLFLRLGWFITAVLSGLALQSLWYVLELRILGRMSPSRFLGGAANVLAMTFSTASTAATIPITLRALTDRLGVSRASSQLAACVGTNFNNDGTALYQAVAALFFAQVYGADLSLLDQCVIVITTLLASVGAGGIPSGSFVTLPLIFAAVHLPVEGLPLLLTIDWFLDRCRTSVNVVGDMTVAVLLDRTEPSATPGSE